MMGLFETAVENAAFAATSMGFASFILFCRWRNAFNEHSYYSHVGRIHAAFGGLTVASFFVWCLVQQVPLASACAHAATVGTLFFLLHYGFFHQVIGLVKKSVSLNLLLRIAETEQSTTEQLLAGYADGRGTDFLVDSRIEQMRLLRWVRLEGDQFLLTASGKRVSSLYQIAKHLLGLQSPFEKCREEALT